MTPAVNNPTSKVYFDPPEFGQINPPKPAGRPTFLPYHEITPLIRVLRENGWDSRAVVVERKLYSSGLPATYDMSQIKNWGFVKELRQVENRLREYRPIVVQWFGGAEGDYWPEDLLLIHAAVSQYDLDKEFKEQIDNDPPV